MRKQAFCVSFIFVCLLLNGCTSSSAHRRTYGQETVVQRVAVPDFNVKQNRYVGQDAGKAAATMFMTAIHHKGTLSPVDRSILKSILEEQKLQQSGLVDEATAVRIGYLTGADIVSVGSIERISFTITSPGILLGFCEVDVSVKLIDAKTGRLLFPLLVRTGRSFTGGVPATLRAGDEVRHDILGLKRSVIDMINDAIRNATEKISDSIDDFMKD
jgi:curli biogenesis system outer membrane secretion channel CsgG